MKNSTGRKGGGGREGGREDGAEIPLAFFSSLPPSLLPLSVAVLRTSGMDAVRTRTRKREEGRTGGREGLEKSLPRSVTVSRTSSMKAMRTRKRKRISRPRIAISTLGPEGGKGEEWEEMKITQERRS